MIIYKAINKVNGKIYIGQTSQTLEERIQQHLKSAKKPKSKFHKALKKWGISNFDWIVLEQNISTKQQLNECELKHQHSHRAVESGYNMVYMAGGGTNQKAIETNRQRKGKTWEEVYSPEGLQIMKDVVLPTFLEVSIPNRFNNITKELQKQYASMGGKTHKGKRESKETCKKISEGLQKSEKFKKAKQNPEYKKQRSIDSKANWSDPNSTYNTPEYRNKLRKAKIARFEKAWADIKPQLQKLIEDKTPKMKICKLLNISHPTLQKYIALL